MKSKIAGVALAALMACGWMGGASAAKVTPLTVDFTIASGSFYQDPNGTGTYLSPSDFPATGSLTATFTGQTANVIAFSLDIGAHHFGLGDYSVYGFQYPGSSDIALNFDLHDQNIRESSFTVPLSPGRSGGFVFNTFPPDYSYQGFGCNNCVVATSIGGDVPSFVPLPASAPLFGAGVAGLAVLSYGAKRKRTA